MGGDHLSIYKAESKVVSGGMMTCPLVHFIVCMSFDYTLLSSIRPLRGRITLYNYCATTTTTTLTRGQVELPVCVQQTLGV